MASHNEKMQFEELNIDEFEEAFKSLKRNKASGFDGFSSNIIIDAYDSLKNILFHAFDVSVQQRIFSDSLRIAKVTLIFKYDDKRQHKQLSSHIRPSCIFKSFRKNYV